MYGRSWKHATPNKVDKSLSKSGMTDGTSRTVPGPLGKQIRFADFDVGRTRNEIATYSSAPVKWLIWGDDHQRQHRLQHLARPGCNSLARRCHARLLGSVLLRS